MPKQLKDPPISLSPDGFSVLGSFFRWEKIVSIIGYKLDLYVHDQIRMRFEFDDLPGVLDISEESAGYQELVNELETRFSFPEDWWERVAKPPFKTNETTLFRRA